MAEWFEDESFWEDFYPTMFGEERFEIATDQVDKILALTGFEGRDVLDLCCGPGRHSVLLAKRGFRVTGVDRTPFLLNKAKQRAGAENVQVEWVLQDMRDFARPNSFDLVLNLFTSFGYFDDKSEDMKVLRNIFESLRSGGTFLIDVIGKEYLARVLQATVSADGPDGSVLVQRHEIFDDWSRIRNEWILVKGDRARTFRFHHTIYSAQELKDRLYDAGFANVKIYGDLDGNEYGSECKRLIAVARKS